MSQLFFLTLPQNIQEQLGNILQHNSLFARYSWSFLAVEKQSKTETLLPFKQGDIEKVLHEIDHLDDWSELPSFLLKFWNYYPESRTSWIQTLIEQDRATIVAFLIQRNRINIAEDKIFPLTCFFDNLELYQYLVLTNSSLPLFDFSTIKFLVMNDRRKILNYLVTNKELCERHLQSPYWLSLAVTSKKFKVFRLFARNKLPCNVNDVVQNLLSFETLSVDEYFAVMLTNQLINNWRLMDAFRIDNRYDLVNWLVAHYFDKDDLSDYLQSLNDAREEFVNYYRQYLDFIDDDNDHDFIYEEEDDDFEDEAEMFFNMAITEP